VGGGFLPSPTPKTIQTKRLVFDSSNHLFTQFQEEYPECKMSKSTFINIEKAMGCCKAKGIVDGCSICLSQKEPFSQMDMFLRNQHQKLVKQSCRAIRVIREFLPRGLFLFIIYSYF
jgi:hypothetical protein